MATGTKSANRGESQVAGETFPAPPIAIDKPKSIPPLRNGDFLSRAEFERRYDAMPHLKKAELIEGVVYIPSPDFYLPEGNPREMASPVSYKRHSRPHYRTMGWLNFYSKDTPGIDGGDNGSLRLDLDNMPQPDAFLIINPENGGRVRISADDYIEGAPELVMEVAYSSVSYDLHAKLNVYRRNEAQEYVVWRVEDQAIDWFRLRDGRYERLAIDADGYYRSQVFPGLWLDPRALIEGEMAAVFEGIRRGVETPEHAAFVERLKAETQPQGERS